MTHSMVKRRGMDGGLKAPKTCQLVPPGGMVLYGYVPLGQWWGICLTCEGPSEHRVEVASTRESAIEAHLAHFAAEHGSASRVGG